MLGIVRLQRAGLVYSKYRKTEIVKSFIAYIVTRQYHSTIKMSQKLLENFLTKKTLKSLIRCELIYANERLDFVTFMGKMKLVKYACQ